jgi:tetratricopeptide (TPR) repeat protein
MRAEMSEQPSIDSAESRTSTGAVRSDRPLAALLLILSACASRPRPPSEQATRPPAMCPALMMAASGAQRLDGLGHYHRPITTTSSEAQAFFDQGLRLYYAFNHDEALRSFSRAASLDDRCAMCFWGASLALGPNYNMPMFPDRAATAWCALQRAEELASGATEVERVLVASLAKRYLGPQPASDAQQNALNQSYSEAMRSAHGRFGDDVDVGVLFAESLMDLAPWKLYTASGEPAPGTAEIVSTLEAAIDRNPEHPGANHFYIHAVEASKTPERGLASAERVAKLMPSAGHLVHMPAHIYQRLGRYHDASAANRKAADVDLAYAAQARPRGEGHYVAMYTSHNYQFLAYSAAMEGHRQEALAAAVKGADLVPDQTIAMMPSMEIYRGLPVSIMVRFGAWDQILATPEPAGELTRGFWLHAHGIALAQKDKLEAAQSDLVALRGLIARLSSDAPAGFNTAKDVLAVAVAMLEGKIALKRGDSARAVECFEAAVHAEDALAFDDPPDWFYSTRAQLGAALLANRRRIGDAERVFREDLKKNPGNGWSLLGLSMALELEKRSKDADDVKRAFRDAWKGADVELLSPAY